MLHTDSGVWQEVNRLARVTTVYVSEDHPSPAYVHPLLAVTALINADWSGRLGFHGGAFLLNDGVWGLVGARGAGKSSCLAWVTSHGHPVIADDVVITDGERVFSGPRCLDLRKPAAEFFGVGDFLGVIGNRERWRVSIEAVPPEAPLRGWISLEWGDEVRVDRLAHREAFGLLAANRAMLLRQAHPVAWLDVATKPVLRFVRPRDWNGLDSAMAHLLEVLGRTCA